MRRIVGLTVLMAVLFSFCQVAMAETPLRPMDLTKNQFDYLRQLEAQPEHAAILNVQAAYKTEHEKRMDIVIAVNDALTAVYYVGMPVVVSCLVCASL